MTTIPTTQQLYNSTLADLQSQYGGTISLIGKVMLRAIAAVWAGKLRLQYLLLAKLQKNIWVDTADPEAKGGTLERYGRVRLNREPAQAQSGKYKLMITGSIGAVIKANTTFKSDDSSLSPGYLFVLDNQYTLTSPSDTIIVRALTPGIESKLNPTDTLTVTSPLINIDSVATVILIDTPPLAAEDIEDYRTDVINSFQLEPQGGAATDYRLWSSDAQGVKIVYPYAKSGAINEVDLYIEATVVDSSDGKGTPYPQTLLDVEDVVNFNPNGALAPYEAGRRPLTVIVNYLPITVKTVDIDVTAFVGITAPLQALLFTAIKNTIDKIRPYVDAADLVSNKNDILDGNKIINAILNQAPGSTFGAIVIRVNGVTVPTYTFTLGDIPSLNSVNYV